MHNGYRLDLHRSKPSCWGGIHTAIGSVALLAILLGGAMTTRAGETEPRKVRVSWQYALIEEALVKLATAAGGHDHFLCDSYDGDERRGSASLECSVADVARGLGKEFERTVIQAGEVYAVRHDRWYDLGFAAARTRAAEKRPRSVSVAASESGGKTPSNRVDIRVVRTSLETLAQAVQKTTREKHLVHTRLVRRRVSGSLTAVTTEQFRHAIVLLFPDSEWVRYRSAWMLREKENAELIRSVASMPDRPVVGEEGRLRLALRTQVAADLTRKQKVELQQRGELSLPWQMMSPTARGALFAYAHDFLEVIERSGGRRDQFVDFDRPDQMGVRLRPGSDGLLAMHCLGQTADGKHVVW